MIRPEFERYVIPALERAMHVLNLMAAAPEGVGLADMSRQTGIPKSTLFRILVTLQKHQCVQWDESRGTYSLSVKVWEWGAAWLGNSDLFRVAGRHMRELAEATGESVFLGTLEEGEVIYVQRVESQRAVTAIRKLGQRAPAHRTATGIAMLAFLPDEEVRRIISAQTGEPLPSSFQDRLEAVRERGVAIVDGEFNPELLCISAPVRDQNGHPSASLTLALLSVNAREEERILALCEQVRQSARALSREVGFIGS